MNKQRKKETNKKQTLNHGEQTGSCQTGGEGWGIGEIDKED